MATFNDFDIEVQDKRDTGDFAKETTLSSIDGKVSTEAKQDTQITEATSTNTKLDTLNAKDFSTSAKQDTGNSSLSSIDSKVSTAANQTTANSSLSSIDTKLTDNATATLQTAGNLSLSNIDTKVSTSAKQDTGNASLSSIDGKVATSTNQTTLNTRVGDLTETAPATDTASSGLNGRLQRIAQRLTSLIALIPSSIGIAWFSRISDGTNTAAVTVNNDLRTADILNQTGAQGSITLGTTATEVKVGGSKLANRKSVTVHNNSTKTVYWGYTSGVTTATGTPIAKSNSYAWDRGSGANATIYIIADDTGLNIRVTEGA